MLSKQRLRIHKSDSLVNTVVILLYKTIAERLASEPLTEDRVYRLLKEQSFLGVTESNHTGGGQGEGSYLENRLLRDRKILMEALNQSDRF
ncbi:hypothetical protein [Halorientalis salina]|uniref:hypothetical protein n=1 Tax=Halorientalis salina TaxID=2932266 RepID=UPI002022A3F7|nr:hypothetical protein [Halorientalis salina]